jgi:hypothetical protein
VRLPYSRRHFKATQDRGEKVKFLRLEALNTRKADGLHDAEGKGDAARLPQAAPIRPRMDISLIAAAPLGLGVLIALGSILVMVAYLSE